MSDMMKGSENETAAARGVSEGLQVPSTVEAAGETPPAAQRVESVGTPIPRDLGASIVDDYAHDLRKLAKADAAAAFVGMDAEYAACPLFAWDGTPTNCRACNKPLTGRQQRWCSDECGKLWGRNHWWSWARSAALRRDDNKCVRCGSTGTDYGIGERGLQVHHKVPILGRHGETGCHHHLDGLETLCRRCHGLEHHGENSRFAPRPEQLGMEEA